MDNSYKFIGDKKPYYEKYNKEDNYVKVLFNPGKPLQAQELGNMQTYQQNQLATLGDTLYKSGSPASGGYVKFSSAQSVLRVVCNTSSENFIPILNALKDTDLYCKISGITYQIRVSNYYIQYQKDSDGRTTNNILNYYLLFSYLTDKFTIPTLTPIDFYILSNDGSTKTTAITATASTSQAPNPTKALIATNDEGYIYIDGYFVHVNKNANANTKEESGPIICDILNEIDGTVYSSITIYDDNNNAVYVPYSDMQYYIGYEINRNYITSADDENLLDQAAGVSNYKSSGADRYQILPILTSYYYYNDDNTNFTTASEDFIQSLVIKNDTIIKEQVARVNGTLEDTLAERTYDESGSYTVDPWKVQLYDIVGDNNNYTVQIDPGLGYIMGYRVQTLVSTSLTNDKPRNDYLTMNDITTYVEDDCYTYGLFQTTMETTEEEIAASTTSHTLQHSENISGLKAYTKDRKTSFISGSDYTYDSSSNTITIITENMLKNGSYISYNYSDYPIGGLQAYNFPNFKQFQTVRVYSDTLENIRALDSDVSNTSDKSARNYLEVLPTSYLYANDPAEQEKKDTIEEERESKIRMKVYDCDLVGKYFMIYFLNTKYLSSIFAQGKCICTVDENDNITAGVNLYQIDGFAKLFGTEQPKIIETGSKYVKADTGMNSNIEYTYTALTSASCSSGSVVFSIPTNTNSKSTVTSNSLVYIHDSNGNFLDTSNLDFDVEGVGSSTYVTISKRNISDNTDLVEGETYTVAYKITQNGFIARTKTLKTVERTYKLPNDGEEPLSNDDINLEKCDVLRIDKITINGTEIDSSKYTLDTGQRDYVYDYGHVTGLKKSGSGQGGNEVIIRFTYYEHSGYGPCNAYSYVTVGNANYFDNGDSYANIPTYTATNGTTYELRDCLDFRPLVNNAIENYPMPTPDSSVTFSFQRYLARYDRVCVSKDGEFFIQKGIASDDPELPNVPDGSIAIYNLLNAPYTISVSNVTVSYINNQRYTMKDISHLDDRITNLETAIALNQLEQSAANMQITDSNGLNRYKTGIFSDNFSSFDNCDYTNALWNCNIDAVNCCICPQYECENIDFKLNQDNNLTTAEYYPVIANASAKAEDQVYTGLCTMKPKKIQVFAQNPYISETHNVQGLMFYTWYGAATLSPSIDTWVNNLGNKQMANKYKDEGKPATQFRYWFVTNYTYKNYTKNNRWITQNGDWATLWSTYTNYTQTTATTDKVTETTTYVADGWTYSSTEYNLMESQDTYMRVREVEFDLVGMKPGSYIKAKFDTKDLPLYSDKNCTRNIGPVNTDGTLSGYFKVPANMTVGTKLVQFYNSSEDSTAEAEYQAYGKTIWTEVTDTYIRTYKAIKSYTIDYAVATKTSTNKNWSKTLTYSWNTDPIAQTFLTGDTPIILDSIDVYFGKIDDNTSIELYVVETVNGYPGEDILAYSDVVLTPGTYLKDRKGQCLLRNKNTGDFVYTAEGLYKTVNLNERYTLLSNEELARAVVPSEIKVTTDSLGNKTYTKTGKLYPIKFIFSQPLALQANTEYAFVVATGSYSYELCTSTLGGGDIITKTAIKEQPYTGSMFISQNARAWTTKQESDVTFRINQYIYDSSKTYSAVFDINYEAPKDESGNLQPFFVDYMNLCSNTFCPTGTNLKLYYRFGNNNNWNEYENKSEIFTSTRQIITNGKSLQVKFVLSSENDTVSPEIDMEQVYGIFTYYNMKYLSPSDGVTELEYNQQCHDSYSGDDKVTFDTNVYENDAHLRYHTGTYISNKVTLEKASNTIRVLMAVSKPNNSDIRVFFKTTSYKPYYITAESGDDVAIQNIKLEDGTTSYNSCVKLVMNMYTYSMNSDGNYEFSKVYMDSGNGTPFSCYVSSMKNGKVYLSNISEKDLITSFAARTDDPKKSTGHNIFIDSSELITEIKTYDSTKQFYQGDYVYDGNNIWRVLEDISGIVIPLPKYISTYNPQFELVKAFSSNSELTEEEDSDWRPLSCTTESKSTSEWIDYTYVPNDEINDNFTEFKLKVEMYSYDEVNVPEFKDLRAIAIV